MVYKRYFENYMGGDLYCRWEWYGIISEKLVLNYIGGHIPSLLYQIRAI